MGNPIECSVGSAGRRYAGIRIESRGILPVIMQEGQPLSLLPVLLIAVAAQSAQGIGPLATGERPLSGGPVSHDTGLGPNSVAAGGGDDSDQDGIPDIYDTCPTVDYDPGFDWNDCGPMDQDPSNDSQPECKARERVAQKLIDPSDGAFITHMAFAVVKGGVVHFADAFTYIGQGQYEHAPGGINRLYRVGSTSKSVVAVAAKVLEESGGLSLEDFVSDDDATQVFVDGEVSLGQLLSHRGAFRLDNGALHLFCYPQDLAAFWLEPDDLVSPHYDSPEYGNLGGGYAYSAFNYSLAGAYMANRTGEPFHQILQTRVFDAAEMCTATVDGSRATGPKSQWLWVARACRRLPLCTSVLTSTWSA